jgi:acetyltransferase-like isoleucine patch superfamily enzyme
MKFEIIKVPSVTSKNTLLQAMMFLQWPLLLPAIRSLIKMNLINCQNIEFIPGFRYLFGNIYAENVYFCDAIINDYAAIHIGNGTYFSPGVSLITSYHDHQNFRQVYAKPIFIGKKVWIASRSIILGGVEIGDNAVIGAGSVVTKSVPKNCFAAGNPAKILKRI